MRTGTIDVPLHGGECPGWLFQRMRPLAGEIGRLIVDNHGTGELLRRLSDPMFFQALGCALGFDWHSSGLTTTTCGALKEGINPLGIGVVVTGGKGKTSRMVPEEIERDAGRFGLDPLELRRASFLCAKVDGSCIQAGYSLYHHSFFFDEKGNWAVVQQGMNDSVAYARRYHWFNARSFVEDPPDQIAGIPHESALNLVSAEGEDARKVSVDLVKDGPARLRKYFGGQTTLFDDHHSLPKRHEILREDLTEKDWKTLEEAYQLQPENYQELVCLRGMGKKKLRALALLAKLIHGSSLDWKDPVKYSFAHGGKDGIPYPVDRPVYDDSIGFLKETIEEAKNGEKARALLRLARL